MPATAPNLTRRDAFEDEVVLGVLDAVERNPTLTQRSIARELGVALGLTNAYLKRCVRKGLIKVSQVPPRRYTYYLTPHGFAEKSQLTATYLARSFSFFRGARTQCSELFAEAAARGQRRLVLLGTGDLAEIATLVAREHPVEIVDVIEWTGSADPVAADLARLGRIDGAIVTAVVNSREVFEMALAAFGADRVYVPPVLRLRVPAVDSGTGEAVG